MSPLRWFFLVFLWALLAGWPVAAAVPDGGYRCFVCDLIVKSRTIWLYPSPTQANVTNHVCDPCEQIKDRCIHCSYPVKLRHVRTSDGRFICRVHVPMTVLHQDEARNVFRDATDELRRLARGEMELRQPEISVQLFDVDYWRDDGGPMHLLGMAKTTFVTGRTNHNVVLLSGQMRQRLAAIGAHEYAHLWINENKPKDRVIEPQTIEALCELAAWKVMEGRGQAAEQRRIEANPYTEGRIHLALRLEQEIGFIELLRWVRHGQGSGLVPARQAGQVIRSDATAAWSVWQAATRAAPPKPTTLRLQGIVQGRERILALINGVLFGPGDEAPVGLADRTVTVHCVEVLPDAVRVRADGGTNVVTLRLETEPSRP